MFKIITALIQKFFYYGFFTVFENRNRKAGNATKGEPTTDPDKALTWKRIYDPTQVEASILDRNITHFGQAEGTLFTRDDFTELCNYEGTTTNVIDLLQGNLEVNTIPDVNKSAQILLNKLSQNNGLPPIENSITFQEFSKAFAKWNESTSTSPADGIWDIIKSY
jgi:hypothetical protein